MKGLVWGSLGFKACRGFYSTEVSRSAKLCYIQGFCVFKEGVFATFAA